MNPSGARITTDPCRIRVIPAPSVAAANPADAFSGRPGNARRTPDPVEVQLDPACWSNWTNTPPEGRGES